MSNKNDNDLVMVVVIGLAIALMVLVFKFSKALNLDFDTGAKVFVHLAVVTGLVVLSIYTQWFSIVFPFILGAYWFAFWPALDYWATASPYQLSFGQYSAYGETPWWAQWYTKGGVFIALVGTPYLIKKIRSPY